MEQWNLINQGLATISIAIVALFFIYATRILRQKLKAEHLTMIRAIVGQAVQAAEQYGGDAEEKKRQAIGLAQKWLEDRGIYLDLHDLDAAVEAAVYSELTHFVYENVVTLQPGAASHRPEAAE